MLVRIFAFKKPGFYIKEPTCTEAGVWRYACTEDKDAFHEVDVPALDHEWSSDVDGKEWGEVMRQLRLVSTRASQLISQLVCGEKELRQDSHEVLKLLISSRKKN